MLLFLASGRGSGSWVGLGRPGNGRGKEGRRLSVAVERVVSSWCFQGCKPEVGSSWPKHETNRHCLLFNAIHMYSTQLSGLYSNIYVYTLQKNVAGAGCLVF